MLTQEQLETAIAVQGVYKAIAGEVKTSEPGNMRSAVDSHFMELYDATGSKTFELRIGGSKVGTYSLRVKEAEERVSVPELKVVDSDAYFGWCVENGFVLTDGARVAAHFEATGDIPPGCEVEPGRRVSVPKKVTGTMKVDPGRVAEAMGARLPKAVAGLLEGGSL